MGDDTGKAKRRHKQEEGPEKKQKLESSSPSFEVQPEVENFQREALWRSLQDYKRRGAQSQDQLEKLQRTSQYHDDHLRLVDVWWDQLLEEIEIISQTCTEQNGEPSTTVTESHFFDSCAEFTAHLTQKRQHIMGSIVNAIKHLRSLSDTTPANSLQEQNINLSARLKMSEMNVRKLQAEKEEREPKIADLQERLASSQRKVDRQKSITLARIELQARKIPTDLSSAPIKTEEDVKELSAAATPTSSGPLNGLAKDDRVELSASNEHLLSELADQQKRLATLMEQNAVLNHRLEHLKMTDLETSEPYKVLSSANEHLRGQNEYLERLMQEASQESSDLKAERTKYRDGVVEECNGQVEEIMTQLSKAEHDLARVRGARDDLHSSLQLRKAQDDTRVASAREISELADTQSTRIAALEAEIVRLKADYPDVSDARLSESAANGHSTIESTDQLWTKMEKLRKENESLKNELPTMEKAFNQAHEQNMRKVMDLVASEDKVSRLQAEKSKADQKYFAAMKAKDQLSLEIKVLKTQVSKSSETINRLHEAEESQKARMSNLEKQIALLETVSNQYKLDLSKKSSTVDALQIRVEENNSTLSQAMKRAQGKEEELASLTNSKRSLSEELEKLKRQYEHIKALESANTGSNGESDQLQVYRSMAMCSVCSTRWKDTALTSCGHVFCKDCVDKRVETRQRRCPSCNKGVRCPRYRKSISMSN